MTKAEISAKAAEGLPGIGGFNLDNIKRQLTELLSLIGREGVFDEYTKHDITHVDRMLESLEHLIPDETKDLMTPADWALLVLAIYFHDAGMLVTRAEYAQRGESGFAEFRDAELSRDQWGQYRDKVDQLGEERAELFLYQEFVRHHHAQRIGAWIKGEAPRYPGISNDAMSEIDRLLGELAPQFRRDLSLVCESHHRDDLGDLRQYRIQQSYGPGDAEKANLQYAALLLRTADLLHITRDRTPSIMFRLIDPTDPVSQLEWAKQEAVRDVSPQWAVGRDGTADRDSQSDTMEVYATFEEEAGFFGLTAYLIYARREIARCYEWAHAAARQGAVHVYPWRNVVATKVDVVGCMPGTFRFTIDQTKILDLLTGNTLYNDTGVAVRELVQNSLDAVRLQRLLDGEDAQPGRVNIHWDTSQRTLSVEDNGTGMTQSTIVGHLLKVGASLYQDDEFRKAHPSFSPISRFGIGVLATFMIADIVEIVTCHPDESKARRISLRSVHGEYLIREMDKQLDEEARGLAPHGTLVRLYVRPTAELSDMIETVRRWVLVPGCEVAVSVDDGEAVRVGFEDVKCALQDDLASRDIDISHSEGQPEPGEIRVKQVERQGVTLTYAVRWNEWFRQWEFLSLPEREDEQPDDSIAVGTCVEGIRVESASPGYERPALAAIANYTGLDAPKTNVARSGLEVTPQLSAMLHTVYSLYGEHIEDEMRLLQTERGYSLTWASQEAGYSVRKLLDDPVMDSEALKACLRKLRLVVAERDGKREAVSVEDLHTAEHFWTIQCSFFEHAEWVIREAPTDMSLSAIVSGFDQADLRLPAGYVLCGFSPWSPVHRQASEEMEVDAIHLRKKQRRIDLRWVKRSTPRRWWHIDMPVRDPLSGGVYFGYVRHADTVTVNIARTAIDIAGLSCDSSVVAHESLYLLWDVPIANMIISLADEARGGEGQKQMALRAVVGLTRMVLQAPWRVREVRRDSIKRLMGSMEMSPDRGRILGEFLSEHVDTDDLVERLSPLKPAFDLSKWERSE